VRLDNGVPMQQSSSRVAGDTVQLGPGSAIYNLADNALVSHNSTILGVRIDTMDLPYLTMPAFPAIAAGAQDVTVKKNAPFTLTAGSYGRVSVQSGATLRLSGGLYQFESLDIDQHGTVLFQAAVQLRIHTNLDADTRSSLILDPVADGLRASQVVIYVAGGNDGGSNSTHDSVDDGFGGPAAVNIGERAVVQANIHAPNGSIWLKSRSQATGAFIGQHVFVGSFSTLTLDSAFFGSFASPKKFRSHSSRPTTSVNRQPGKAASSTSIDVNVGSHSFSAPPSTNPARTARQSAESNRLKCSCSFRSPRFSRAVKSAFDLRARMASGTIPVSASRRSPLGRPCQFTTSPGIAIRNATRSRSRNGYLTSMPYISPSARSHRTLCA
jgi:hypothetical protein